jgi:hypothetical protein
MIIIDHIQAVNVVSADAINELITLESLSTGLSALANQVALLEQPFQDYEARYRKRIFFTGFGMRTPDGTCLTTEQERLLPCLFHWYGNTICNYARLVGFLSGVATGVYDRSTTEDPKNYAAVKRHCGTYVDSITELEAIKHWRNKVFAHFALTDPYRDDNATMLDVSVMSPITYLEGRFRVGGMVHSTRGGEIEMPHWSITESHEKLSARFWPQAPSA